MKEDQTDEQVQELGQQIQSITNVGTVTFISKEESLQKYAESIPEATFESLQGENNPLLDSFIVSFEDLAQFDSTLMQIEALPGVDSANYDGNIAEMLTKVRHVVMRGRWLGGCGCCLSFPCLSLPTPSS